MNNNTQPRIDSDVHCVVPSMAALLPYLSPQWRDYVRENGFEQSGAVNYTYPPWSRALATSSEATTLVNIQRDVLGRCSYAILNCYYGLESMVHAYFSSALASAVNDWLREEKMGDDRLLASIVVAPQDAHLAAVEIDRVCQDRRFVQVLLPARAWAPYGDQRYFPIWEAAARNDLAVAIHYGGVTGNPPSAAGWMDTLFEEYAAAAQLFQTHLVSLVAGGVFESFPNTRVVLIESGYTWIPAFMWKMDTEWRYLRREVPWIKRLPSEYVRQYIRATTQPTDAPVENGALADIIEQLGVDHMLMYASDYPHDHSSSPERVFSAVSPEHANRIAWRNAWESYGLESRLKL